MEKKPGKPRGEHWESNPLTSQQVLSPESEEPQSPTQATSPGSTREHSCLSRANYSAKVLILSYLAISDGRGGCLNFSAREKMLIFLDSFHSFLVYFAYIQ